ncbi:hypothetical protein BOSEA1005_30501 [Hyphomicrobiales bacterium]|nr:hypothetical protein BOSEA1005_30501 [Hyphomicrobiales bacterium]
MFRWLQPSDEDGFAGRDHTAPKARRPVSSCSRLDRQAPGSDAAKSKAKAQATARLAAIEQAIATKAGDFVFPNGEDLSRPFKEVRMSGLIE